MKRTKRAFYQTIPCQIGHIIKEFSLVHTMNYHQSTLFSNKAWKVYVYMYMLQWQKNNENVKNHDKEQKPKKMNNFGQHANFFQCFFSCTMSNEKTAFDATTNEQTNVQSFMQLSSLIHHRNPVKRQLVINLCDMQEKKKKKVVAKQKKLQLQYSLIQTK